MDLFEPNSNWLKLPFSFVANVGGLMGLCIGFSFVSVVELVCFMCKSNKWMVCRRLRCRQPIKPFAKSSKGGGGKKQGKGVATGDGAKSRPKVHLTRSPLMSWTFDAPKVIFHARGTS